MVGTRLARSAESSSLQHSCLVKSYYCHILVICVCSKNETDDKRYRKNNWEIASLQMYSPGTNFLI